VDNAELFRTLRRIGALPSPDKLMADAVGYVGRMTEYKAGSPMFKQAVADLIDHDSTRVLKGINRDAVRGIFHERERAGDDMQLMVWVGEGGNPCGPCSERFGEVRTWAQWAVDGLPGSSVCLGGMLCHCVLYAVH